LITAILIKKLTAIIPLALFSLLIVPHLLLAQAESRVTGSVYEAETGNTLAGANIYFPDSRKGTSSNANGEYILKVEPGSYQMVVSYIGFKPDTLSLTVEAGENVYDVRLQPDLIEEEEIVVYSNRLQRRVRKLADLRNEQRKNLQNYSVTVHKLGLVYETMGPKKIVLQHLPQLNQLQIIVHMITPISGRPVTPIIQDRIQLGPSLSRNGWLNSFISLQGRTARSI
jgi:hypothetical protein